MADSYRFVYYNNSALGSSSYFNFEQPYNTNWLDEITDTGTVMSNFLSIAGGSQNANYYLGYTNYKEEGILNGTDYERNNINSRMEVKLFDDVMLDIEPLVTNVKSFFLEISNNGTDQISHASAIL